MINEKITKDQRPLDKFRDELGRCAKLISATHVIAYYRMDNGEIRYRSYGTNKKRRIEAQKVASRLHLYAQEDFKGIVKEN